MFLERRGSEKKKRKSEEEVADDCMAGFEGSRNSKHIVGNGGK